MKLAYVLYDQFGILDLAGPVDTLRGWPDAEVHFVGPSAEAVVADSGMVVRPTTTIADLRDPDVVVVPGTGRPDLPIADDRLVDWIRDVAPNARWMASICTGAGLLARAGLLEGRRATTHWAYRDELASMGVEVVKERYVIEDGVATAAGVSAGIDMALALIEAEFGAQVSKVIQLAIEYDPQPPFDCGSPEKAGEEITRAAVGALIAAARQTAGPGTSVPLTVPSTTEVIR